MLAGLDAIAGFVAGGSGSGASGGGGTSGSFYATVDHSSIGRTGNTVGPPKTLTTSPVTVTAHGGAPGYTYAWTRIIGSGITATTPSLATTQFTGTLNADTDADATFRCTVTDSVGSTATVDVAVTLSLVLL